jgi:hypothetical protein
MWKRKLSAISVNIRHKELALKAQENEKLATPMVPKPNLLLSSDIIAA